MLIGVEMSIVYLLAPPFSADHQVEEDLTYPPRGIVTLKHYIP